jgi:hypothetical protein
MACDGAQEVEFASREMGRNSVEEEHGRLCLHGQETFTRSAEIGIFHR